MYHQGHANTKPAWSEDHSRDDLIADVVYCAGGSSAFTTTLSPTKAPTKAPTPLSEHATISAIAAAITALEAKVATLETTVAAEKEGCRPHYTAQLLRSLHPPQCGKRWH